MAYTNTNHFLTNLYKDAIPTAIPTIRDPTLSQYSNCSCILVINPNIGAVIPTKESTTLE
jgi:hypothetical protein